MNLLGSVVFVSLFKFFNPEETFTLTGEVKSQAAPWHTKQTGSEPLGLGLEAQYSHSGPEILQKPWKMLDCCFKNTFQRKVVVSLSNNASFHFKKPRIMDIHRDCHQFSSVVQSCPTLCDPMDCSTPGFLSITNSWSLLKLMSIESVILSNHLIL